MKSRILVRLGATLAILLLFPVFARSGEDEFVIEKGDLIRYTGSAREIVVPEGVERFAFKALEKAEDRIAAVMLPNSIKTFSPHELFGLKKLAEYHLHPDSPSYTAIDGVLFSKDGSMLVGYPFGKKGKTYAVPKGVIAIGRYAFTRNENLQSVVFPQDLTRIGEYAFASCPKLLSAAFPESLLSIGGSAYEGCAALKGVSIPAGVGEIGASAFGACKALKTVAVAEANQTFLVIDGALVERGGKLVCFPAGDKRTKYTVPEGILSVGARAFYGCGKLTAVTVPEGVAELRAGAFEGCTGLTKVMLPGTLRRIRDGAFMGCSKLTSLVLPDGTVSLGAAVFLNCNKLKTLTVPASVTSIGNMNFVKLANIKGSGEVSLVVREGSYAHRYAMKNSVAYSFGP